jgi:hypothetical protein
MNNYNPKVGDKVTTSFIVGQESVVRTITDVDYNSPLHYSSGVGIAFDGGEKCTCCGKTLGTSLSDYIRRPGFIDSAWVTKVE